MLVYLLMLFVEKVAKEKLEKLFNWPHGTCEVDMILLTQFQYFTKLNVKNTN